MPLYRVLLYSILYFIIGAAGVYVSNRHKDRETRKKKWLKFIVYFFITNLTGTFIAFSSRGFQGLLLLILLFSSWELIKAGSKTGRKALSTTIALICLAGIAYGLYYFSSLPSLELIWVYALIITFDGFCQIAGQTIGRHKLIPSVSPNKTWEGLIGGLFVGLLTALLIRFLIPLPVVSCLLLAAGILLLSLFGDLLASYYKRIAGIKDYGKLIPGHGGVLDRYDSFLLASSIYPLLRFAVYSFSGS